MNPIWRGSLSIGVTALPLDQVIVVSKAKKLQGQSFVISSSDESTVLYIGGQVATSACSLCAHVCACPYMCVCACGTNNTIHMCFLGIVYVYSL